ncbi:hypothetical protein J1N35_000730 [Gossypium stocksii]|uniref:Uncharacterized protein n=1 Tax=Gossypium stocksii TaxID=47602 RepID=A0A9D3WHM1_9ROSI|nr:hypothetical protein J1N35_000730 [Gossypium stocksii]
MHYLESCFPDFTPLRDYQQWYMWNGLPYLYGGQLMVVSSNIERQGPLQSRPRQSSPPPPPETKPTLSLSYTHSNGG